MGTKLDEYNQKRDFLSTAEPEGVPEQTGGSLRFAVQHHMARKEHYDLRLEWDGVLLSWAVPKRPSYNTRDKRLAVHVEDHPLEYRNFEGTIPKGEYGGGTVMLWDEGFWEPLVDVDKGLSEGSLKLSLSGRRLKGNWALVRMKTKGDKRENWLLIKERDDYANAENGISGFNTSIRTGRTMKEIEDSVGEKTTKNPFQRADAQLLKLKTKVPEGDGWLYELKYDGYRILAFIEGNTVRLVTRNHTNYTTKFGAVVSSLLDMAGGRSMVLDGEMTVTDPSGKTDFQALQNYLKNQKSQNLTYIIFDILALDGLDLRKQPLTQRKETLLQLMNDAPKNLHYSQHIKGSGKESFEAACALNMEGIVGKRPDSVYSGTRNGDWIKIKCNKNQEFIIGGYTQKTRGISALLLGLYEDNDLIYVGRAGSGLSEASIKDLETRFGNIKRASSPFKNPPKEKPNEKTMWVEPNLSAEIKFSEWTNDNLLRHASFKGLGKTRGETGLLVEGVKISNPQKVLYDDIQITKGDVVNYYSQIAERMLPYIEHRILSAVRCPKGVTQACFFKKHPGPESKGVVIVPLTDDKGKTEDYFYIDSKAGLISEAQMGTLEFHIWASRVETLETPDMMVFDLDPDEEMDLKQVRQGAKDIRSILSELTLNSFIKTSGGKGYHIVVPLKPTAPWGTFYGFAKNVAEVMEKKWPDRYTSNSRKSSRTGKIFIDWIRNGRGATSVAPYSLRARDGACVSMPITWDELDSVAPDGFDMHDALKRLQKKDPWEGFFTSDYYLYK